MNKVFAILIVGLFLLQTAQSLPTFELISNTDQCLVNCEAVLKMTTDNVGFTLPIKENANFKLEFLKDFNAHDIEEYTMHLGTEQIYYEEKPIISTRKEKVSLDYNISGCPATYTQQALSCEKEIDVKYISGYDSIEKTKIVYQDFFKGLTVLPNSVYYIRVRARKKPKLGANNIDWVATIAGQKLTQYAWFNSNWLKRKCFTVTNESGKDVNITDGYVFDLNSQHFDFPTICTALSDFDCLGGMVYNGLNIPMSFEDDNTVAWVKLQADLDNGNTTPSGEAGYCLYYDNSAASEPLFIDSNFMSPAIDTTFSGDVNLTLAMWHLRGDEIDDVSVNNLTLTEFGSIDSNTTIVKYDSNSASDFSATDYFESPAGVLNGLSVYTVELDFYWAGTVGDADAYDVLASYNWTAGPSTFLISHVASASNYFGFWQGPGSFPTISDSLVSIGEWHHLIAWSDGTNIGLEIDELKSSIVASGDTAGNHKFRFSRKSEGPTFFSGNLQNIRISNYVINSSIYKTANGAMPNQTNFTKTIGAEEAEPASFVSVNFYPCGGPFSGNSIDLNISSDLNIQVDLNIFGDDQNIDSLKLFTSISHAGDDENTLGYVRVKELTGWEEHKEITWEIVDDTDGNRFRSSCLDDYAYKAISANLEMDDFLTSDGNFTLNSASDWINVIISKVGHEREDLGTDANMFLNISFLGQYTGAANKNLSIWDCNSSVATPIGNENCVVFQFAGDAVPKDDTYFSILEIIDDQNQLAGVKLNPDQNHFFYLNCPQCSVNNFWDIFFVDQNSNIPEPRNLTSSAGPGAFVATDKTIQLHTHWQNLSVDHNFLLIVQHTDLSDNDLNSSIIFERIEGQNLPPLVRQIVNPTIGAILTGFVDLNVLVNDPNGDTIVVDINLLDSTGADVNNLGFALTVFDNNNAGLDFNTFQFDDGTYSLAIRVRETVTSELFETDFNMNGNFVIDNVKEGPTVTVVYPNGGEDFDPEGTQTLDISITILDLDSNSFLVDLNFSISDANGTGTMIIKDINTDSATINCLSGTFHAGRDCNVSWNITGVPDGNYRILALVTDDFSNSSFDASDANFQIARLPDDAQNYTERYFNSGTENAFSDAEQAQLEATRQIGTFIFFIFVIILIAVIIVVVRRK